jgi:hypothetical protein
MLSPHLFLLCHVQCLKMWKVSQVLCDGIVSEGEMSWTFMRIGPEM